jgi:hypothetical protein
MIQFVLVRFSVTLHTLKIQQIAGYEKKGFSGVIYVWNTCYPTDSLRRELEIWSWTPRVQTGRKFAPLFFFLF